ncbi:MAG: alpha/beta fold hydrolase [Solirubrobacterales bacterium]
MLSLVFGTGLAAAADAAPEVAVGPAGQAFYNPPDPLPKGKHGDLIWARELRKAPKGADAWRILYRSTDRNGKATVSSGFLVAPKGRAPKAGRPVLAWAHGTEGAADNCAPSKVPSPARGLVDFFTYESPFQQDTGVPAIQRFIDAGYAIVATDYAGLGTPGTQHYTVAQPELRNVLDSVIATQRFAPAAGGKKTVILGWSQGGGAAIWANQEAAYAPSVKVLGAAALAPAADIGPQFAGQTPPGPVTPSSPFHGAAIEVNVYVGNSAAYRELDPSDVLTPAGLAAFNGALIQCINHLAYVIENNYATPEDLRALFVPGPKPADWQRRFNENTAGQEATVAPLLVMQGLADTVINPNATTQYVQRACRFDQPVQYTLYPTATHQTVPLQAKPEYIPWIADRFAGRPAPSNC